MRKKLLLLILGIFVISFLFYGNVKNTYALINKMPPLKDGDLVFQTIKSSQTLAIILASKSPYTHVGIIKLDSTNTPYVMEAVGPVREIPLKEWIKQGVSEKITVMRFKDLNMDDAQSSLRKAQSYYGRPYDFFFLFDKEKIYCSELVYYAFKEGANIDLGQVQKIKDLNFDTHAVTQLIQSRWHNYPPCISAGVQNYENCLPIIMEQTLITPASIAQDPKLELVYSNYKQQ